jgi:hypothetical protein
MRVPPDSLDAIPHPDSWASKKAALLLLEEG